MAGATPRGAPPRGIEPGRDFGRGTPGARREVVWYDSYAANGPEAARAVLRRALGGAAADGRGRIALRVLPRVGDAAAELRARAVIAAGRQGAPEAMHLAVTRAPMPATRARLRDAAAEIGLDPDRLAAEMDAPETDVRLAEDRALAARAGFEAGPLLFIDGRLYDGALDEAALVEALERPLGLRLRQAGAAFFDWAAAGGLVLVLATIAALIVVNSPLHHAYEAVREGVLSVGWNGALFSLTVEEWVNDGAMTLFFLLVGIEIKREVVSGELSDPRRAALPIAAALGGMAVPAAIFYAVNAGGPGAGGWGVPMATDIAFTLGLLALLGSRVPTSLRVFVSALAIADDLGAIVIIALFYSEGISWEPLGLAAAILAAMAALNRGRVYALWPYLVLGLLLWAAVFAGGLHATLAGVLTALAIPSQRPAAVHGVAAQTTHLM